MTTTSSHRQLVTAGILIAALALLAPTAALSDSSPESFKAWQNRWGQMLNSMSRVTPEKHITYKRHRKPARDSVVTLPDPLPTRQDIDVEVEWFFTYLSDSNNVGKITPVFDSWIGFWRAEPAPTRHRQRAHNPHPRQPHRGSGGRLGRTPQAPPRGRVHVRRT